MRLVISAYACAPDRGSDHGVGWMWVTEAHRLGHRVWAFASTVHRSAILRACAADPSLAGIDWWFPEVAGWPLTPGVEPEWERSYNLLWQREAARQVKALLRRERIDAIHHASWAGIRAPTFLGGLGPPLILGPVGGGETSPAGLRDAIGMRGRLLEAVRDLSNRTITLNPIVRPGLQQAEVIFAATPETERLFRGRLARKLRVFSQLALPPAEPPPPRPARAGPPRLIYAGRLLYWKGVHIALRTFARVAERHPGSHLTIVGGGRELARLRAAAQSLKVADSVRFVARLPQAELFGLYDRHDLMLFPSLHDSGGMAALEALSRGLPVLCLDLGGPGLLVTDECGVVIPTAGRGTDDVAAAMSAAIDGIVADPGRLEALSAGALRRAAEYSARSRAQALYQQVAEVIGAPSATPPAMAHRPAEAAERV
ncbi:glycosyltransferase family 4 protein [Paracraurococcus lichenis]|uniref:Glycosyltransferase family 4 protein n=1 Tax=Paracraurococcus lichenis TaxID=3064888 RepID=A0ABT9E8N7_9PROT|nr:glycosyltransferase family 4 protein [Paracraurococcus sp. LOR1-02]MDO9712571.1 glycosyltransferase family 4 protein [Paracraurococcus sp. LOR1-02]